MSWRKYSRSLRKEARGRKYSEDEIRKCLDYAKKLYNQELPIIFDQYHLSLLVQYDITYLYGICNFTEKYYRTYSIPKKNGGKRLINEPLPSLKQIQHWILHEILYKLKISDFAKAYAPKSNVKSNAKFHRKQKYVLSLDIEDFFGSLKIEKVFRLFRRIGYSAEVSAQLAHLCTLNNVLPQGAPTSPTLSNLLFYRADKRISGYCLKNNIRYTRYADDMAFSGDFNPGNLIKFIERVVFDEDLNLCLKKTRLMKQHQRQEVTGIVTNDKMQVSRELRKKIRQQVYYIQKYGLGSHLSKIEEARSHYIEHLIGQVNYMLYINPDDNGIFRCKKILEKNYT